MKHKEEEDWENKFIQLQLEYDEYLQSGKELELEYDQQMEQMEIDLNKSLIIFPYHQNKKFSNK